MHRKKNIRPCSPGAGDSDGGALVGWEVEGATTPRGGKSGGGSGLASDEASSFSKNNSRNQTSYDKRETSKF